MPTTADYLNDLVAQRNALADNLVANGIQADHTETFNTLVPKLLGLNSKWRTYSQKLANKTLTLADFPDDYAEVVIPESAEYMFNDCFELTTVPWFDLSGANGGNMMFNNCQRLETIPQLDFSRMTTVASIFNMCYDLKTLPNLDFGNATNMSFAFYSCRYLESIESLDMSKATSVTFMFNDCRNLVTINFVGTIISNIDLSDSPLLTHDSLMSAINALSVATAARRLTLGATNLAKLTENEKAIASGKGWALA